MAVPFAFLHPGAHPDHVGELPLWLNASDPRPAREQFNAAYGHGGGWSPMPGFQMTGTTLHYPGDPSFEPLAVMMLRDETIYVYLHAIVAIVQKNGAFEVARMD